MKLLLKLDADTPINPRLLDDDCTLGGSNEAGDESMDALRRKRKPSQKQRKSAQLRRANPQREANPMKLSDHMVEQAEEKMESGGYISRG